MAWYRGDYPAAVKIVEEAVNRNPTRVWPHLLLASSYADQMPSGLASIDTVSVSEMAVHAIDQALALRPNSGRVLEWAGDVFASLNRFDEALEYYNRALKFRPRSSSLLSRIALTFRDMGENEKAVQYAFEAVKQSPGIRGFYYDLRSILVHPTDRWEEFFHFIQQAAVEYGDDPLILYMLSKEQNLAGQFEKAIITARRSLEIKKTSWALAQLAIALWFSGDTEAALAKFKEALIDKYYPAHWLTVLLKSEGRFNEVEEYLNNIKEDPPSDWSGIEFWANIAGRYYQSMRRYNEAQAVYTEQLGSEEKTWSVDTRISLAICYKQNGHLDSAQHIFNELVNTSTGLYIPYILGQLALIQSIGSEDLTNALKLAEQAQTESITPNDNVTEVLLLLQFASGKIDGVKKSLEQLGSWRKWKKPSHRYRKAQFAEVIRSSSAGVNLDQAISNLRRGSQGGYHYLIDMGGASAFLAMALARAERPDEARNEIKRAIKFEPEREDIAYNAACAYSLLGDTTLALQWLETAVERNHLELWWAKVDPDLDPLRELPRFKEIMTDWDKRIKAMLNKTS